MKPPTDTRSIDREIEARLRSTGRVLGVSQILAKKVGVTFQQIQKCEKGINRLSAGMLVKVCQSLEVSPLGILAAHLQHGRPVAAWTGSKKDCLRPSESCLG
ncbi:helix-turn-helix transcriptional regulator (plasmid) [Sinorhizobium meliloti]|uniref:helix-turn-helix domain-containing protein n=1 Tax=Rhizobium meliloti TaxID=382 RepID=UPI002D7802FC|nr:helix-turn-helix transcriptional regulator [Sinorhizobium meliloti]WRQ69989.1 helix-turn-helix transcriptional regulator [Sinorhizobium meliloti]